MNTIITDSHPLAIATIRSLLVKNGIEILAESIESGDAVQQVEALKSGIVIIDIDIPGASGIQVLGTLRKHQYNGIIIIIPAKSDHFHGRHCTDAGTNGFMSKREGMNSIIAAIEVVRNSYCHFPFSLNRFVEGLTPDQQKLDSLSKQEISVVRYTLDGRDSNDVAGEVFINNRTVNTYKSRSMEKLKCGPLTDLYTFAQRNKVD